MKTLFFTELSQDVRLEFTFGVKEVIYKEIRYTFIEQLPGEPAKFKVEPIHELGGESG